MGIPYQRAVTVLLPQNISVLVSSKVVQPIIEFSSPLAMMADTKVKCCVKLLACQPRSRMPAQG